MFGWVACLVVEQGFGRGFGVEALRGAWYGFVPVRVQTWLCWEVVVLRLARGPTGSVQRVRVGFRVEFDAEGCVFRSAVLRRGAVCIGLADRVAPKG